MSDGNSTGFLFDFPAKKKRYPGGGRPLRQLDESKMIELYKAGRRIAAIGEELNCHQETIRRRLRQLGVLIKRAKPTRIHLEKGQRFGKLSVVRMFIQRTGVDNSPRSFVECKCECGKIITVRASNLTHGNNTSCGCKRKDGANHPTWKGHGDISGLFWAGLKNSAGQRKDPAKRVFTITIQEAWQLFLAQDRLCALSGLSIKFARSAEAKQRRREQTASLDRIDSSRGYTLDNVQWVHRDVNCIKTDMPEARFVELCCLIADWQRKKQAVVA